MGGGRVSGGGVGAVGGWSGWWWWGGQWCVGCVVGWVVLCVRGIITF